MTTIACNKCKQQIWPQDGQASGVVNFVDGSPVCQSCLTPKSPFVKRVKWEAVVWDFLWVIGTWYAVFELNRSPWWWVLCVCAITTSWYEKESR